MIIVKAKAGHSLTAIADHLGLEHDTVYEIGITEVSGPVGRFKGRISKAERAERNKIIIELWEKGMKMVDIVRKLGIGNSVVEHVINKHRELKRTK